jgi:hypothetical protein
VNETPLSGRDILVKTVVTHTLTYFIVGLAAFVTFDYAQLYADTSLKFLMRQTTEPLVIAGPLFQPIRGLVFGSVFCLLRTPFFEKKNGWLVMWIVLVAFGIIGTFGPTPGSLEGLIYTILPLRLHILGLPEILAQSLLLSVVLFHWVNHPKKRWLNWCMGSAFIVVLVLPVLALVSRGL